MTRKVEETVYAWISIQNGNNVNGGVFAYGQPFYWANPVAGVTVTINGCGGFCTETTYTVPPPPPGDTYGLSSATLLPQNQVTSWDFGPEVPNEWNAPGMPHLQAPTMPKKEVA